ncbi:hypothetical protein [Nonomuraea sp. CA-141351]
MGTVRAYDLVRMLSADGRPTGLDTATTSTSSG